MVFQQTLLHLGPTLSASKLGRSPVKPKTPHAPCVAHQLWEHLIAIDTTILRSLDSTFNPTPKPARKHTLSSNNTQQDPTANSTFGGLLGVGHPPHTSQCCDLHFNVIVTASQYGHAVTGMVNETATRTVVLGMLGWFSNHQKAETLQQSQYIPRESLEKMCYYVILKKVGLFNAIQLYNYLTCFPHAVLISIIYNHLQIVLTSPKHIQIRPTSVWAFIRRRGSLANARSLGAEIWRSKLVQTWSWNYRIAWYSRSFVIPLSSWIMNLQQWLKLRG